MLKMNNIKPLYQIHLGLSSRCNMNCMHCYSRSASMDKLNEEMSRKQWIKILDEAMRLGCFKINLIYGEPLLFDNLFIFLKDAIEREYDVEIATNGSLLNNNLASKLWNIGVRKIHVSIDFPDKRHDEFRRYKHAFKKAKNAVTSLRKYPFRIKVVTTQLPNDKEYYDQMLSLCENLKVNVLYFLPSRTKTISKTTHVSAIKQVHDLTKKKSPVTILCHDPIFRTTYGGTHGEDCMVGNLLHIAPDGNASSCPLSGIHVGNVFNEDLKSLWFKVNQLKQDGLLYSCNSKLYNLKNNDITTELTV